MKLKICDNLHLIDGAIISYSTQVGIVTSTGIKANGKYSRSTTKHIGRIAGLLGTSIEYATVDHQWFNCYELGVKVKCDGALGQESTRKILAKMRETSTSLLDASIMVLPELKGKDRDNCVNQLLSKSIDRQRIDDVLVIGQLGLL